MGLATAAISAVKQLQQRQGNEIELAEDNSGELVGISISFAVITTILVGLRFYAKRFQAGGVFADEIYLSLAWIVNLGMCALGIVMTKVGGVGRHVEWLEENNPKALVGWAQCIFAFEIVYFTSVALPKCAILSLYLRMFNWRGGMRTLAWIVFALVAMTSISLVIAACFQCRPIAFWWDRSIKGGVCFDVQSFFHAQAIPGFVLDLVIMGMPVDTIWKLKLPMYKRLALVGIFLIASFGIVASIIRATVFFSTAAFGDRTMASVALVGWSIIETSVYIITGCLPHLKPLIGHYTPDWVKRAIKTTISSIPTKLGSGVGGSYAKSYGRGSRRDHKSAALQSQHPDDDSIELTSSHNTSLKGAVSMGSMNGNSPTKMHDVEAHRVWPHSQTEADDGLSPRVHIRSTSLEYDGREDSPTATSGQITVTREIKMTRE